MHAGGSGLRPEPEEQDGGCLLAAVACRVRPVRRVLGWVGAIPVMAVMDLPRRAEPHIYTYYFFHPFLILKMQNLSQYLLSAVIFVRPP